MDYCPSAIYQYYMPTPIKLLKLFFHFLHFACSQPSIKYSIQPFKQIYENLSRYFTLDADNCSMFTISRQFYLSHNHHSFLLLYRSNLTFRRVQYENNFVIIFLNKLTSAGCFIVVVKWLSFLNIIFFMINKTLFINCLLKV